MGYSNSIYIVYLVSLYNITHSLLFCKRQPPPALQHSIKKVYNVIKKHNREGLGEWRQSEK